MTFGAYLREGGVGQRGAALTACTLQCTKTEPENIKPSG